jgi:hypothetical protein
MIEAIGVIAIVREYPVRLPVPVQNAVERFGFAEERAAWRSND